MRVSRSAQYAELRGQHFGIMQAQDSADMDFALGFEFSINALSRWQETTTFSLPLGHQPNLRGGQPRVDRNTSWRVGSFRGCLHPSLGLWTGLAGSQPCLRRQSARFQRQVQETLSRSALIQIYAGSSVTRHGRSFLARLRVQQHMQQELLRNIHA